MLGSHDPLPDTPLTGWLALSAVFDDGDKEHVMYPELVTILANSGEHNLHWPGGIRAPAPAQPAVRRHPAAEHAGWGQGMPGATRPCLGYTLPLLPG